LGRRFVIKLLNIRDTNDVKYRFIAEKYKAAIETLGLDTPDRWMAYSVQKAAYDRTTETRRLKLPLPLPGVYAKIYRYPRLNDRIRILFRGGLLGRSRARVEFDNLRLLNIRGLSPQVIAYGQQRRFGILESSFLVIEEVTGAAAMDAFAAGGLGSLTRPQRREFIQRLAHFTRKMNAGGFINTEYHWRNILVCQSDGGFSFQVIDPSSSRWWYRFWMPFFDLATLDVCAEHFFTRAERLRFLKHYFGCEGQSLTARQKKQVAQIAALKAKVAEKESKRYSHILGGRVSRQG
jgi:hypothetical protein